MAVKLVSEYETFYESFDICAIRALARLFLELYHSTNLTDLLAAIININFCADQEKKLTS